MLNKQKFKCYICDDMVISCNWKPRCVYQMSIDRINNNEAHNKNNCLISCYYCNCRFHPEFNDINKKCENGCHNDNRIIETTKIEVSQDKINKLKLN